MIARDILFPSRAIECASRIKGGSEMKLAKDFDPGIGAPLLLYTTAFAISFASLAIASTLLFTVLVH